MYKKPLFLVLICGIGRIAQAQISAGQASQMNDAPYDNPAYAGVGSSAYMPLAFQKMTATRITGEIDTIMGRLDTYADYLEILRPEKKVILSKGKYKQLVVFIDDLGLCTFQNGFTNPDWPNKNAFYQVLYEGKTKLLRQVHHTLRDCYEYGGIYRQCFRKQEKVYLQVNLGNLVQIDHDREKIWELLKDIPTLKAYANQRKWKLKRWTDVEQILGYYDSQKIVIK